MDSYKDIADRDIKEIREKYCLGYYCGSSIFDLIERLDIDGCSPLLFRLPFKNNELSGFIGHKKNRFSIFLNSNKTLGHEIFTAAHEIYHILENKASIKKNVVIEEGQTNKHDISERNADMFAVEFLMPAEDLCGEYERLIKISRTQSPDEALIITLQQRYFVEYIAITKRLRELRKIDDRQEHTLNKILGSSDELFKLTLKLGYSNQLNEPSKAIWLPKSLLRATEENYKCGNTTYDDLVVLFGYCDLPPEHFGYEEEGLSDDAINLMKKIRAELGSENSGKE